MSVAHLLSQMTTGWHQKWLSSLREIWKTLMGPCLRSSSENRFRDNCKKYNRISTWLTSTSRSKTKSLSSFLKSARIIWSVVTVKKWEAKTKKWLSTWGKTRRLSQLQLKRLWRWKQSRGTIFGSQQRSVLSFQTKSCLSRQLRSQQI